MNPSFLRPASEGHNIRSDLSLVPLVPGAAAKLLRGDRTEDWQVQQGQLGAGGVRRMVSAERKVPLLKCPRIYGTDCVNSGFRRAPCSLPVRRGPRAAPAGGRLRRATGGQSGRAGWGGGLSWCFYCFRYLALLVQPAMAGSAVLC